MTHSTKNRKRNWIVAVVFVAFGAFSTSYWLGRNLSLPSCNPTQVRIVFFPDPDDLEEDPEREQPAAREFRTSDKAAMLKLVSALQEGRACSDHKCAARGTIQLSYPSGDLSLGFFPGHTEGFYEVRSQGGIYRLPYGSFVEGLVACGVPREFIHGVSHFSPLFQATSARKGGGK